MAKKDSHRISCFVKIGSTWQNLTLHEGNESGSLLPLVVSPGLPLVSRSLLELPLFWNVLQCFGRGLPSRFPSRRPTRFVPGDFRLACTLPAARIAPWGEANLGETTQARLGLSPEGNQLSLPLAPWTAVPLVLWPPENTILPHEQSWRANHF